jgi:putative transposase
LIRKGLNGGRSLARTEDVRNFVEKRATHPEPLIGSGHFFKEKGVACEEKQYQITKRRAAEQFAQWAKTNEVPIQLTIPTAGIAELAQQSVGDLLRSVGKVFIESVMESEVEQLAGRRSERMAGRGAYRWGSEEGFCIIDGQRVPIDRPRVRSREHDREIPLGSYALFQKASLMEKRYGRR